MILVPYDHADIKKKQRLGKLKIKIQSISTSTFERLSSKVNIVIKARNSINEINSNSINMLCMDQDINFI